MSAWAFLLPITAVATVSVVCSVFALVGLLIIVYFLCACLLGRLLGVHVSSVPEVLAA